MIAMAPRATAAGAAPDPDTAWLPPEILALLGAGAPGELAVREVNGGLFNRVLRVDAPGRAVYYKQFTEHAKLAAFPPLPTSPWQRWLVASRCQANAVRCAAGGEVSVPPLVRADEARCYVMMEASAGALLYDAIVAEGASAAVRRAVGRVLGWLARVHRDPPPELAALVAHSAAFKRYKIDLQYERLLPELGAARAAGARFVERYLAVERDLLHGDLNSRNILVDGDGAVTVIDFEQGQVGDGVYDVAYLLSELVIACLRDGSDPAPVIDELWTAYARHAAPDDDDDDDDDDEDDEPSARARQLRVHLAFQVLYRLIGPSRQTWTGHLTDDAKAAVRAWSLQELQRWLT
jgi:tRNA A-37 threonylcarbamoyl transferase component Bud32